jgi:hypothetical protein
VEKEPVSIKDVERENIYISFSLYDLQFETFILISLEILVLGTVNLIFSCDEGSAV